jgi:hypothetical protein
MDKKFDPDKYVNDHKELIMKQSNRYYFAETIDFFIFYGDINECNKYLKPFDGKDEKEQYQSYLNYQKFVSFSLIKLYKVINDITCPIISIIDDNIKLIDCLLMINDVDFKNFIFEYINIISKDKIFLLMNGVRFVNICTDCVERLLKQIDIIRPNDEYIDKQIRQLIICIHTIMAAADILSSHPELDIPANNIASKIPPICVDQSSLSYMYIHNGTINYMRGFGNTRSFFNLKNIKKIGFDIKLFTENRKKNITDFNQIMKIKN